MTLTAAARKAQVQLRKLLKAKDATTVLQGCALLGSLAGHPDRGRFYSM